MTRYLIALLIGLSSLLSVAPASAQTTRDQIRTIEQEYARTHNGRLIPDNQLEYYLDRSSAGWSMDRISADMDNSRRQDSGDNPWRPRSDWAAREVVCSSISSRYQECRAPFQGRAVITQQISSANCVEGTSWGQRPGLVWVNRGCRARFGIVPTGNPGVPPGYGTPDSNRMIVCRSNQGRYRECNTNMRGRVQLVNRFNNSAACIEGRTWGQRVGKVWVSRGCRAQFSSVGRRGPRDDHDNGGGWNQDPNYSVTCASTDNRLVRCNWDARYGTPRMVQQISQAACVAGRTWGYERQRGVWVNSGCRARFASMGRDQRSDDRREDHNEDGRDDHHEDRNDDGREDRNENYSVLCASDDDRVERCEWDSRQGRPRVTEQLSRSACVEGRTWGYDSGRGIWVDNGCRARFGVR